MAVCDHEVAAFRHITQVPTSDADVPERKPRIRFRLVQEASRCVPDVTSRSTGRRISIAPARPTCPPQSLARALALHRHLVGQKRLSPAGSTHAGPPADATAPRRGFLGRAVSAVRSVDSGPLIRTGGAVTHGIAESGLYHPATATSFRLLSGRAPAARTRPADELPRAFHAVLGNFSSAGLEDVPVASETMCTTRSALLVHTF
jgi:hypothetical protein